MLRSTARALISLSLWIVIACSGTPTSPTPGCSEEIACLWEEGQQWLLALNDQWVAAGEPPIRGDVLSVGYQEFFFVAHTEPLFLDGQEVGGIFEPSLSRIHYQEAMMEGAVPHEACHAILYELKDPRWRCVFHADCEY
jgi:hypothetical protein